MKFDHDTLAAALSHLPPCQGVLVGLSGGLDSVVLLHGLTALRSRSRLPFTLRAFHVNHGLHPDAVAWEQTCRALCADWQVDFESARVVVAGGAQPGSAAGLENAAREARYNAFSAALQPDEVLLLAHHRDDQMETLLLRLMRGAGPRGLAGIPRERALGDGMLFRPLLGVDRAALESYAHEAGLRWIEDSANQSLHFDRNYLRHAILPLLEARWPGYRESWSKSAALAAEAEVVLSELAAADLAAAQREDETLSVATLQMLGEARQRSVLRAWFAVLDLPEPGWNLLHEISTSLLGESMEGPATKQGNGVVITRYRDRLAVTAPLAPVDTAPIDWNPLVSATCELPDNGQLLARPSTDSTTDRRLALVVDGPLQIRYRRGGESCHLRARPRRPLKKVLQDAGIEPWLRERLPLLYCRDDLLYVPGIGATTNAPESGSAVAMVIEWRQPDRKTDEE